MESSTCTSSSTSERTYWRVWGWLSRCRMVVIRASLMRLSWQSITFFRMVLRPPLRATISGFFSAVQMWPNTSLHIQFGIIKVKGLCLCAPTEFTYNGNAGAHHAVTLLQAIIAYSYEGVCDRAREELSIHSDHLKRWSKSGKRKRWRDRQLFDW